MPLYMSQFAYTSEAWAALAQNPEDRSEPIRGLLETMGGRLISYYNSFGEYDGVAIFEAPDDESATAFLLEVGSWGNVRTTTLRAYDRDQMSSILERVR
jgi:uncharacterized protein with GYD domain